MTESDPPYLVTPQELVDSETGDRLDAAIALLERWKLLLFVPLLAGCVALGVTYAIPSTFTAKTSFLPPQQQNSAASALASLSALANVASSAAGLRTPADQFVALMQSTTVQNRLIDRFDLMKVYDVDLRTDARRDLGESARVTLSKRDGLISVEVDDTSPQRAADIANAFVEELRRLTATLAITEAQQRRAFFERQLSQTRDRLSAAQQSLESSGFSAGALKSEPRAAAESYAKLRAEVTAAEVRLQGLRGSLVDSAPEIVQQIAILSALRGQLTRAEGATGGSSGADYISKFREYKYQETLFDLFSRQYELARVDEAREGSQFQVIDAAVAPERKSRPKRALIAVATTVVAGLILMAWLLARQSWRRLASSPQGAQRAQRLRAAFKLR